MKKGQLVTGCPLVLSQSIRSADLLNSPRPDTACADFDAAHRTILGSPNLLQVGFEYLLGFIMRMADITASHRFLPTNITYIRH